VAVEVAGEGGVAGDGADFFFGAVFELAGVAAAAGF
jgi:hypothetical protein